MHKQPGVHQPVVLCSGLHTQAATAITGAAAAFSSLTATPALTAAQPTTPASNNLQEHRRQLFCRQRVLQRQLQQTQVRLRGQGTPPVSHCS